MTTPIEVYSGIEKIGFDQCAVAPAKFCDRLFPDSGITEFVLNQGHFIVRDYD